jgi:tetratricopeptide (TPR) repeat protein
MVVIMPTLELEDAIAKGVFLLRMGQFDNTIIYFNQIKEYFKDPLEKILIEIEISWCLENKGNYQESQEEFLRILESSLLLTETKYSNLMIQKTIILIYHGLARVDTRLENIESAFIWAQKALVESVITKDEFLIAKSNYYLALVQYYIGQFDKIFDLLDKSFDVIKNSTDFRLQGKTLLLYGIAYQMTGELDASLKYYNETLAFYENLNDITNISTCLNNMSVVYRLKGEYQISLRLLKKVEVLAEDQGRWLLAYHVVDNITEISLLTGEINAARESAKKLVQMARDNHFQTLIGKALGILAQIEQHNNLQIARDLFEEAIILLESSEVEIDLIECVNRYLKFLVKVEDYDIAIDLLEKYEKIIEEKRFFLYKSDFLLLRGLIERNKNLNFGLARNFYLLSLENANESQLYSSKIKSYIYLAENSLESNQLKPLATNIQFAKEYISIGYELALKRNLYPDIASINLLRSLISQISGDIHSSIEILEETLLLTKDKGLKLQEAQAKALMIKIKEQKIILSLKQKGERKAHQISNLFDSAAAVISTIKIFYHEDFSQIMPSEDQLSVVLFELSEMGPVLKLEDFSEMANNEHNLSSSAIEEILLIMGSSFSIAVGQGNSYQEGLFGPLPVPRMMNNNSLIFSKKISFQSGRTKNNAELSVQPFNFLCLIYPKEFDLLFFDRELLKDEFSFLLEKTFVQKEDVNLKKWKLQFLKTVQTHYLSHA